MIIALTFPLLLSFELVCNIIHNAAVTVLVHVTFFVFSLLY